MEDNLPQDAWIAAFLEEYKALRTEIVDAIQAQRTMLQLGITGESVLIGFAIPQIPSAVSSTLLVVLVPAITVFVVVAAWGDLYRSARASHYLQQREKLLREISWGNNVPMGWERWIRQHGKVYTGQTGGQFSVLYALTLASISVGVTSTFFTQFQVGLISSLVLPLRLLVTATGLLGIVVPLVIYRRLRQQTSNVFNHGVS